MNATLYAALNAQTLEELKRLGKFLEVKKTIEEQLELSSKANSWTLLFSKLQRLNNALHDITNLYYFCEKTSLSHAKVEISNSIGFKIKATNHSELIHKIQQLTLFIPAHKFDAHQRFEETKINNFIHSSRLEGITITPPHQKASLDSILAKHRR